MQSFEGLLRKRDKMYTTILDLERGRLDVVKRIQQNDHYLRFGGVTPEHAASGLKEYDKGALQTQKDQDEANLSLIDKTIAAEKVKLAGIESALRDARDLMEQHETTSCQIGIEDHDWCMTSGRMDSRYERICRRCGAKEKVG